MNICANSKAHQLRSILDIHIPLYSNYTSFLIIGKVPNKTKFKKKKKTLNLNYTLDKMNLTQIQNIPSDGTRIRILLKHTQNTIRPQNKS